MPLSRGPVLAVPSVDFAEVIDRSSVAEALQQLPREEREILGGYVSPDGPSERMLASGWLTLEQR